MVYSIEIIDDSCIETIEIVGTINTIFLSNNYTNYDLTFSIYKDSKKIVDGYPLNLRNKIILHNFILCGVTESTKLGLGILAIHLEYESFIKFRELVKDYENPDYEENLIQQLNHFYETFIKSHFTKNNEFKYIMNSIFEQCLYRYKSNDTEFVNLIGILN